MRFTTRNIHNNVLKYCKLCGNRVKQPYSNNGYCPCIMKNYIVSSYTVDGIKVDKYRATWKAMLIRDYDRAVCRLESNYRNPLQKT